MIIEIRCTDDADAGSGMMIETRCTDDADADARFRHDAMRDSHRIGGSGPGTAPRWSRWSCWMGAHAEPKAEGPPPRT